MLEMEVNGFYLQIKYRFLYFLNGFLPGLLVDFVESLELCLAAKALFLLGSRRAPRSLGLAPLKWPWVARGPQLLT